MAYIPDLIPAAEREHYLKGHMGTRVGFGVQPGVLVVDMTGTPVLLQPNGKRLGLPVVYTRGDAFPRG